MSEAKFPEFAEDHTARCIYCNSRISLYDSVINHHICQTCREKK